MLTPTLKLIIAVSADGYMARGKGDDMRWTGGTDKRVFRLLTHVGGVVGISKVSAAAAGLTGFAGRMVIPLSRNARPGETMTLDDFAAAVPNGWLAAGPTLAKLALDKGLVGSVYVSRLERMLTDNDLPAMGHYPFAIKDPVSPILHADGSPFRKVDAINFEGQRHGLAVEVWQRFS